MTKNFSSFEVGDEVTVVTSVGNDLFGLVSFIDLELGTMSILVKRGSHRSRDVNLVISRGSFNSSMVVRDGWGEESNRKVALRSLTLPS